jgi:hypothetical protein
MAFRKYGGLNYAANNNIVRNQYSNTEKPQVTNVLGQINSKIVSASHIDMSANSLLNVECIYFYDGTTLCTAAGGGSGSQGAQGAQGAPGGSTGAQGATGTKGPTGDSGGSTGAQGPQGPDGLTGAQGLQGPDGLTGAQGPDGLTGAQGLQGPDGLTGAQGPDGLTGAQGATGTKGPTGDAGGSTGAQGPQGLDGPTGAQGVPGGSTGAQGATGATGTKGPTGDPGGSTGAQGPQGLDGLTGAQGVPGGSTGAQGATGTKGPTGDPGGSTGAQGSTGAPGDSYWIMSTTDSSNITNILSTGVDISGNLNVSGNMNVQDSLYVTPILNPVDISTSANGPFTTLEPLGTYTFWYATDDCSFNVNTDYNIDFRCLVVGGGGGGGNTTSPSYFGGGGGGGGGISTISLTITPSGKNLDVYVGIGGLGSTDPSGSNGLGGGNSYISSNGTIIIDASGGIGGEGGQYPADTPPYVFYGGSGGYGIIQIGANGGNGCNYVTGTIPPTDASGVIPLNTFYLNNSNNGYYNPNGSNNAYYSGGGGGGVIPDRASPGLGSVGNPANSGPGGGPGGGNGGGTNLQVQNGNWWGAGGGGGGGDYNNGSGVVPVTGGDASGGIFIIWTETANLNKYITSGVDISGNLYVSGNTTLVGLLDVKLLLPNILTITSSSIPSPTQTADEYTYYVFDTATIYNIQFNYSLRQLNYCILGPGGDGASGGDGGGTYPNTTGGGGGGGGFYSGTILSISSGLIASINIASAGSNSSISFNNTIISTANTGDNGTAGDETGDNGTGGQGGSSSGSGGTSVPGNNAGVPIPAGSPGQSSVTFGNTTISFSSYGTGGNGGYGGPIPTSPTNGYDGYGVIWFLNTDIISISNANTLTTENLVVSGLTNILGGIGTHANSLYNLSTTPVAIFTFTGGHALLTISGNSCYWIGYIFWIANLPNTDLTSVPLAASNITVTVDVYTTVVYVNLNSGTADIVWNLTDLAVPSYNGSTFSSGY